MNFSFGLSELIQAWQVAYLANWVDSKIKPFHVTRHPQKSLSLSLVRFFKANQEDTPRQIKMTSSKQNMWLLFLKEDHPHTKPKLINVAFWQAQPLYDFAESVDLIAFKENCTM